MPQRLRKGPYSSANERIQTGLPSKARAANSPVPKRTKRNVPSVAGVGTAMPPGGNKSVGAEPKSFVCQRSLPSSRRQQKTCKRSLSRPSDAVRKARSFQTTGALTPAPGTGTFQRTFLSFDHSTGRLFSLETP